MPHPFKKLAATALGGLALAGAAPAAGIAVSPSPSPPGDPAVAWNAFLLDLQAMPGVQPATVHPTYEAAITQAAIYDAVVAIDRSAPPYLVRAHGPRNASPAAAADAAAH